GGGRLPDARTDAEPRVNQPLVSSGPNVAPVLDFAGLECTLLEVALPSILLGCRILVQNADEAGNSWDDAVEPESAIGSRREPIGWRTQIDGITFRLEQVRHAQWDARPGPPVLVDDAPHDRAQGLEHNSDRVGLVPLDVDHCTEAQLFLDDDDRLGL